jgi:hypothetical protein
MTLTHTLAGIAWDPQIRGFLAVGVGVVVLMGSVYLILATNLGNRLGFLVSLTAFFGWMVILGIFWWIKPSTTGPQGRVPAWTVEEINTGDLTQAQLEDARALAELPQLPDPDELADMDAARFEEVSAETAPELSGWHLVSAAEPSRGEAQSVVDETITAGEYPGIDSTDDYVTQYVFETGGKPQRESDAVVDRIANEITNTLRITSPPHYMVVQLCPSLADTRAEAAQPGQAPPTPECDPNADTVSVILVRDLGQRRLLPALITLCSGAVFGLLCLMLHLRDKQVAENRAAPLPAPDGSGSRTPVPAGGS